MSLRQIRRANTLAEEIQAAEDLDALTVSTFPHLEPDGRRSVLGRLRGLARIPIFAGLRVLKPEQMPGIGGKRP